MLPLIGIVTVDIAPTTVLSNNPETEPDTKPGREMSIASYTVFAR